MSRAFPGSVVLPKATSIVGPASRGALFEATKLPLEKWFLALYLLTSIKTNMAAMELMWHLGVRYRTAWRLNRKVMQAMTNREETRQLRGFVQIDDTLLGGERNGGNPGRGSENKQAFVIAVEADEQLGRPMFAVIEPVRSLTNAAIIDWCDRRRLMPQAEVFSDGLGTFRRFVDQGHAHGVLVTLAGRGDRSGWCTLGEHGDLQSQAQYRRRLPFDPPDEVCAPLSA